MTFEEAAEKLKRERDGVCRGCMHPSMLGWCENHCKLPEAFDMAIAVLEQPEIIYCKDCAHYHTDVFGGELGLSGIWKNIIVAHNACDKWTKDMNCVTPDGFCFLAERRAENADVNT